MNNVKRWRLLIAVLFFSMVVLPQSAQADEPIDQAINSLKTNPVYVAEGVQGTTPDTAPQLARRLRDNDHLLIVMLPAPVGVEVSNDLLQTTLTKISDAFEGKKIIGLTIGTSAIAAAPMLPAGTASTLMTRAESVGTNPVETLGTFIVNVHDWQVKNPEPIPPAPPQPAVPLAEQSWFKALVGLAIGAVAGVAIAYAIKLYKRRRESVGDIQFNAPPSVNQWTKELLSLREKINTDDHAMRSAMMRVCTEVEAYFAPTASGHIRPSEEIEKSLKWAKTSVVEVYLKLQNTPTYYRNVDDEKRKRVKAMQLLADRMHNSVVDLRRHDLEDIELDLMDLS